MRNHLFVGVAAVALVAPAAAMAQETSGTIRGAVVDGAGAGVAGAEVVVRHDPSGSTNTVTSDAGGSFNAAGLRLGGPYTLTVTAPGFPAVTATVDNLLAGTPQRLDIVVGEVAAEDIVVTGSRVRNAASLGGGPATVLSARDIAGIASVDRDIRNLAARDPLVTLDPSNNNSISIAGQNNRFNRFTVDGIAFGDPFGLESGGLVSARGPVPLDAISEFSVEVAPVDIQQGFFQGGAINSQLRSGGNEFTGLIGGFYSADSLRGDQAGTIPRRGDFESQVYTAQITGPIIRDKLFFAVTYERLRDTVASEVTPEVLGITADQITRIQGIGQSVYNFDTLGAAVAVPERDDKLVAKIDWNIADGHRLAATYIYNESSLLAGQTGAGALNATNPTFSLQSSNYDQGAVNHFGVVQLNNQWSDNFSTQARVSYADYVRNQVPFGDRSFGQFTTCLENTATPPAPTLTVAQRNSAQLFCQAGIRQLQFGPDISRQANELDAQSLTIETQATIRMNNHAVKLIAERRRQDIRNLFAQRVSGQFYFDSITDLQARRANQVQFAVPTSGDIASVTADFQNNSWTFGIQDTWEVTPTLVFTYGVRYDLYDTPDVPVLNTAFSTRYGFSNQSTLNGRDLWQPRFGLNWNPTDRLAVRATAGIFGGGNPNVWISNSYSNPGPLLSNFTVNRNFDGTFVINGISGLSAADVQRLGALALNNVSGGTGLPAELLTRARAGGALEATTNAIDPDFRVPSQWRFSGSVDYEADFGSFGDGWRFGADVVYSKVRDALTWTDLRSVVAGTLPDGRPRYQQFGNPAGTANFPDILLTNTGEGQSWNAVARVNKRWQNGVFFAASYTYQDVDDVNSGTSSVALSNYNNSASLDPNNAAFGVSSYQRDHAYRLNLGYDADLFGIGGNTRIELFYNNRSGQRFSYTFADIAASNIRSPVFGTIGTNNRYLAYIPNVASINADPLVTYADPAFFAEFQQFIQNGPLARYQGQIAPKNVGRVPRYGKLDLSFRQQLPVAGRFAAELFADLENVMNLLDSDRGLLRQVAFPYYGTIANVTCAPAPATAAAPCTRYQFNRRGGATTPIAPPQLVNLQGSLWSLRLGARIRF